MLPTLPSPLLRARDPLKHSLPNRVRRLDDQAPCSLRTFGTYRVVAVNNDRGHSVATPELSSYWSSPTSRRDFVVPLTSTSRSLGLRWRQVS